MRSPTPRQWTAIALTAVALPALTYTAWPLVPFLAGLLPEALPLGRILWGLLFAAVLAAAAVLARSGAQGRSPWLGWLIIAAWAVAIAAVAGIVLAVWLVLGSPGLEEVPRLSPKDLDAIATRAFAVVAGLGGVALLTIAYRRQRTTENSEQRETTKLFTERFTTASEQLGSEHAAVRLAGVHALAHLADDAPEEREDLVQMVIDVLCAYLRMPYTPAPEPLPEDATDEQIQAHHQRELEFGAFREVRHTIIRIIGNHLREPTRWRGKDYDFTGVVFDGGDLTGAHITGGWVSFNRAEFTEGSVDFFGARFTGGKVSFLKTNFTGGTVFFGRAQFTGGEVFFLETNFTGGEVFFFEAEFTGGEVSFNRVRFTDGVVNFYRAEFTGGKVSFDGSRFSGGKVFFALAKFAGGTVNFYRADFTGGKVSFLGAEFAGGMVNFYRAKFTGGKVSFRRARFTGGEVSFNEAEFANGEVDFHSASGVRPTGLPASLWGEAEGDNPGSGPAPSVVLARVHRPGSDRR